ncbi:hypothetical protein D3C87_1623880 [compost metagenome]
MRPLQQVIAFGKPGFITFSIENNVGHIPDAAFPEHRRAVDHPAAVGLGDDNAVFVWGFDFFENLLHYLLRYFGPAAGRAADRLGKRFAG